MDLSWIITAILGLVVIYVLYYFATNGMNYWETRPGVPFAKPLPFFGSMLPMVLGKKTFNDLTTELYKTFPGEKYVGFMMSKEPVLLVRDIELVNRILIKDFGIFQDRFVTSDEHMNLNAAGLQSITGEKWRVLRHKLTPTLTSGKLKSMFQQIKGCCDEAVEYINVSLNKDIEIRNFATKVILNVIGDVSFGVKVDALNDEKEKDNALYQNTKNFFAPSCLQFAKFMIVTTAPKIATFLRIKLINEEVEHFFKNFLRDLIDYRQKDSTERKDFLQSLLNQKKRETELLSKGSCFNNNDDVTENEHDENEPEDIELMGYLKNLDCNKTNAVFTDQIIAGQAFTFISGGTDTVAAVLSFTFYELAQNKDIQSKLQDEIDRILQTEEFSYEAVRKMKYVEQVLNESIRLRTPGGTLTRVCLDDYKIPDTEVIIEKGTLVHIPISGIHHDPQYFTDPEKFDPGRFDNPDAIPKGVFMPFGDGPRICIAMRLAMLEMKIFLATLFCHYNVTLSKKTELPLKMDKGSVLPRTRNGIWIQFTPRK